MNQNKSVTVDTCRHIGIQPITRQTLTHRCIISSDIERPGVT